MVQSPSTVPLAPFPAPPKWLMYKKCFVVKMCLRRANAVACGKWISCPWLVPLSSPCRPSSLETSPNRCRRDPGHRHHLPLPPHNFQTLRQAHNPTLPAYPVQPAILPFPKSPPHPLRYPTRISASEDNAADRYKRSVFERGRKDAVFLCE